MAEALGMKTVFIHPYAGVLSAYGMGLADRRVMKEKTIERTLSYEIMDDLHREIFALSQAATAELKEQGEDDIDTLEVVQTLQVRYAGTDSTLTVDLGDLKDIQQDFEQRYQQQYGITLPNKGLVVSAIIAEAIGKTAAVQVKKSSAKNEAEAVGEAIATIPLFSADQWHQTPVFQRESIHPGVKLTGPAIILEKTGTNIIEPNWTATVNDDGALVLTYQPASEAITSKAINRTETNHSIYSKPDPVRLEIFNSLFQTIAEQMGFTLQNTSSSVNIKERLDFSCAIFDGQGQLVANAPHIPVHLGSMGESVQALIASQNSPFQPGNTYISNNPYNGGTHLPDVTAITPVFISVDSASGSDKENQPLFFVASRGHHADIGGITPGSMPPNSTHLEQEGVLLDNFKLIDQGELQQEALRQHLSAATYPVRNPDQNIADLQAQVAANNKGAQELHRMVQQFGLATVQAYMQHVQNNAEQAVRRVIQQLYQQHGQSPLVCQVPMDCGASIQVSITIASENQALSATIDFTGTSDQQPNNFNAPLAVCKAAVLYVFRTLVDTPIPLNAGCLKPLSIVVPDGCLLNPSFPAAVVAGNVETSQAVTDSLYGALGVLAASQGTMNNFTFGNQQYQYYETICGGSGAGPTFPGTDAVQNHKTNSSLTDPEIMEKR